MDIEFRHLAYFVAVAEEGSFNRGAARLNISQPTLSRQIADIECMLQRELFARSRSGVTLTSAGREFLVGAQELLQSRQRLAQAMQEKPRGKLRIGYIAPSLFGPVGEAVRGLRQSHPDLEIQIIESPPGQQIDLVLRKELDIGFVGHCEAQVPETLELVSLYEIPLAAVLPTHHPLACESEIALEGLASDKFVGLRDDLFPGRQEIVAAVCRRAGFEVQFDQVADSLISLIILIGHDQGVSLIPQDSASLSQGQVVFIPLAGETASIQFHAVIPKGSEACPAVGSLLEAVRGAS